MLSAPVRQRTTMPINNSYNEDAIVEAIATALDNFYMNLIKKVDSLNVKAVMKRKNPYLFRAKAMNGAAQIIDAILAAFVSSSEETIFGNVFFFCTGDVTNVGDGWLYDSRR